MVPTGAPPAPQKPSATPGASSTICLRMSTFSLSFLHRLDILLFLKFYRQASDVLTPNDTLEEAMRTTVDLEEDVLLAPRKSQGNAALRLAGCYRIWLDRH